MKKTKRLFFTCLISMLLATGIANAAVAATAASVELTGIGDSQVRDGAYAGFYELKVDGLDILAMCDDRLTEVSIGDTWMANSFTFADIQAGAPVKFASSGVEKYSQVGYLFNILKDSSASDQADFNLAIWEIMTPGSTTLNSTALAYYNDATSGAYDNFNFGGIMGVLTPDPVNASQEYLFKISAVPIPAAVWLFGSGLLGLVGVARRT